MTSITQATLGCHADEKMNDESENYRLPPNYMWMIFSEPKSNYAKKKRRAQAEKERALEAQHNKKICPAVNFCGKYMGTNDCIARSEAMEASDDNEAASAKPSPCLQQISRLVDARSESSGVHYHISSVQFNKESRLVLAAGSDGKIRLSQIDGEDSNATRVYTMSIQNCAITRAAFMPNGSEVIVVDDTKFIYSYDLTSNALNKAGPFPKWEDRRLYNFEVSPDSSTVALIGNNRGYILLISPKTKEKVGVLRMDGDGSARSVAYADGGNQLLSTDGSGHVYLWDLRTGRCVHKATACLDDAPICASLDSSLFAVASSSGFVKIYNRSEFVGGASEPAKVINGLARSSSVEQVKFSHDAQLLAMISRSGTQNLRLVHLPSCTFSSETWAKTDLRLHSPCSLDFSPSSGLMAVGTFSGNALLCRTYFPIKHGVASMRSPPSSGLSHLSVNKSLCLLIGSNTLGRCIRFGK
ncbi:hypothetical protein ACP70R_003447 [Stipagrostis hirtigluma subsp. patula]